MIIYYKNKIIDLTKTEEPFTIFYTKKEREILKNIIEHASFVHGGAKKDLTNEEKDAIYKFQTSRIETHIEKIYGENKNAK